MTRLRYALAKRKTISFSGSPHSRRWQRSIRSCAPMIRLESFRSSYRVSAGHEYSIEHAGEYFYIRTNRGAENFCLKRTPETKPAEANWKW